MMSEPCLTNADEHTLVEWINSAHRRILYIAPGVTKKVAQSLVSALERLEPGNVTIVLDLNPEVYRLGYGTMDALGVLRTSAENAGAIVCQQPDIRIGLVIADEATLVFAPVPELIESSSDSPSRLNAIRLASTPTELAPEVGLGEHPEWEQRVGLDSVLPAQIEQVSADLNSNPPAKFDLARRVRVFTSHFQYAELEMTGCYISRRKVHIPSSLVGLANEDEIKAQFHAQFNLVDNVNLKVEVDDRELTEDTLIKRRKQIAQNYLIPLKGYGSIILRSNKDKMMEEVEKLRKDIELFQNGVKDKLLKHIDRSVDTLTRALLPAVQQNPPRHYTKIHGAEISEEIIKQLMIMDINHAFMSANTRVNEMKVRLVFKDMAYESLMDEDFLKHARDALPGLSYLHEEFDAAPATESQQPLLFD